jgi:hypothetical protein
VELNPTKFVGIGALIETGTRKMSLTVFVPIFGLLASLFIGFLLLGGETRGGGERLAYRFFAFGAVWVVLTGAIFWTDSGLANAAHLVQSVR